MPDSNQIKSFAELVGLTPDQLRKPASRALLGQVVDKSSEAIRSLTARVEMLERRLASMEADHENV